VRINGHHGTPDRDWFLGVFISLNVDYATASFASNFFNPNAIESNKLKI
jgi:hypothetical protein